MRQYIVRYDDGDETKDKYPEAWFDGTPAGLEAATQFALKHRLDGTLIGVWIADQAQIGLV